MTNRRSLPSPPQARVLRAMEGGAVLERVFPFPDRSTYAWWRLGAGRIHSAIVSAMKCAGWVAFNRIDDGRCNVHVYALTPAGTFALRELERTTPTAEPRAAVGRE